MTDQPRSIPEVVDQLRHEFDGAISVGDVTEVVRRLSANGAVSLPVLANMARSELADLTAPDATTKSR